VTLQGLHLDRARLEALCRQYHVARLEVFGSFARGDANEDSDLDVLVTFKRGAHIALEIIALRDELTNLFGRPVDLLTRSSVEHSPNKYFRRFTLENIERLYESA
jgi:predicted nucleotidyltransferase